ncbi:MAG: hypothetical protein ACRD0Z_03600 [Acidimicrobiales bacterium]
MVLLVSLIAAVLSLVTFAPSNGHASRPAFRSEVQHKSKPLQSVASTLAPGCAPNAPSVAACSAGQQEVTQQNSTLFPPSPATGQTWLTATQAVTIAQQYAGVSSSTPAVADQTTYAIAASLADEAADDYMSPGLTVWLVSISGSIPTAGIQGLPTAESSTSIQGFTVILDAANGEAIDRLWGTAVPSPAIAASKRG